LNLRPTDIDTRSSLGLTLVMLGRLEDARGELEKVLRAVPRHADGLYGLGLIEQAEGRFTEAEDFFKRSLVANPQRSRTWLSLANVRKMTASDKLWLKRAEQAADSMPSPSDEAAVRFAIGKYFDDVGEYAKAFKSYERANGLVKSCAAPYDRKAYTR